MRRPAKGAVQNAVLALAFTLVILASLTTSALLFLEILPASPGVLAVVGGLHLLFGWAFLRAYANYRSVMRLVHDGRGELFDMAMGHRIAHERFAGMRDHLTLRRVEGLALAGLPLQALAVVDALREAAGRGGAGTLDAIAAEAQANVMLERTWWAEQALARAEGHRGAERHAGLRALRARLAYCKGDAGHAARELADLTRVSAFPLTAVIRARNLCWYGEALERLGQLPEAARAWRKAARLAPRSPWGRRAARHG